MRVLWLSPIELPAVAEARGRRTGRGGGWIESLRARLAEYPGVDLGVACVTQERFADFESEGVAYFALTDASAGTGLRRVAARIAGRDRSADHTAAAIEAIARFRPDVVHVHGTETTLALVSAVTDVPTIVSLQGHVEDVVEHYLDGVTRGEVARDALRLSRTLRGVGILPAYRSLRRCVPVERVAMRHARFVTGRTDYDRRAAAEQTAEAAYFHCDRILRPEFYERPSNGERTAAGIYCTGGGAPYKGVELVLEALAVLAASGSEVTLRVAGIPETSSIAPILQRRARRLGVTGRVSWLGQLDAASIVAELDSCAVFVHASHVDNSPNSLAEAMMRGVPCVAAAVGGIPSMVEDGVDGVMFRGHDAASLADALRRVLGDPAFASALGTAAATRARERHDPDRIVEATVSMYEAAIGGCEAGARDARG